MKKVLFALLGVAVAFIASAEIDINRDVSIPYNMYVDPGTESCLVTWEDDDNSAWNLRYRLFTDETGDPVLLHSLNGSSYTGTYQDITLTAPWGGARVRGGQGALYFRNNYKGDGVPGYITYTVPSGYSNATFTLKLTSGSDATNGKGNFTVSTPQTEAETHYFTAGSTYEWEVTASSGELITISTPDDNYSPDIALIEVYYLPEIEWTYVYNLDKMAYTIENLERGTDYEVQVQAIGDDGTLSDWNRADVFTTLLEDPIIPQVHIMGEIDDQIWAPDAGTKMEYDPETQTYTLTVHVEAGNSFGFSLEIDDNGDMGDWNYILPYRFGPESNGEFYLTDERLGQTLTLTFDNFSDVYILSTGDYEVTVSLEENYIIIGRLADPDTWELGDVDHSGSVDIDDITMLINKVLGSTVTGFYIEQANCDNDADGIIDIDDVTALISRVLSGHW